MKRRARRVALIFIGLVCLLLAIPTALTWLQVRQVRQQRLNPALIAAVEANDDKSVVSLLDQGADANCRDEPQYVLTWWQALVQILRFRTNQPDHALTPLLIALDRQAPDFSDLPENIRLVRALLDHGAHVNVTDVSGNTPLFCAIHDGKNATIRMLLTHGANARETGLLTCAATYCNVGVITELLDHGADVNQRDFDGHTALGWAVETSDADMVRLLLARHADVKVRGKMYQDTQTSTLLALARRNATPQIVRLLKAAGAKE